MCIDRLLAQHVRILNAVARLEEFCDSPRPETVDGLSRNRWMFTRDLMLHFGQMESAVYAPMRRDLRVEAVELADQASKETAKLVADFRRHAKRWHGLPSEERWDEYRVALKALMMRIRQRLDHEARIIATCLPLQPRDGDGTPGRNPYVSQAWEIRELIYHEDDSPVV
jgi:hypothetical protein